MNKLQKLKDHFLATQPLRDILWAVVPATLTEKRIVASLACAYDSMGTVFPSEQLRDDLDALYSNAFSVAGNAMFSLAQLKIQYGWLAVESKEPSLLETTSPAEHLRAVFAVSGELNPEMAPVLRRCYQFLFLALDVASIRISAALKLA
jgi:hypothetical protein